MTLDFEDRYGPLDRLLHRIAFRAGIAQRMMAEIEEAIYGDELEQVSLENPVFISALPRSGTTILLQLLVETGHFASHTYREMPFVLCPLLWRRFSEPFSVSGTPTERAHGDGLQVSADSPEAFEEMIWKHFWRDHYEGDRIRPWRRTDQNPEFDAFFELHMRKIIALRRNGRGSELRYVSKNNLNIARLAFPPAPLTRGRILIPFREPIQHAASMLRQHRRFLRIQEQDGFVREYMEAIGHHEFGRALKPVDFDGWLEDAPEPEHLAFWVRYWTAAYEYVLEHGGSRTVLVSYQRMTKEPEIALRRLARTVGIPERSLVAQAKRLHPPRNHDVDLGALPTATVETARGLEDRLNRDASV